MCVVQSQVGCIHPQKHHTLEEMVCHNPTAHHGGVRSRVYACTRYFMLNKMTRLKKWLRSWRANLPDESLSRRDAWWMFDGSKNIKKNRLGTFIRKSTTRPRKWSISNPKIGHGGVRSRVYAFARHSVSNKVIRLKKWLRSWRADLPDESLSRRDAWWMFEGRIPTKQIEWRRVNVSFHFSTQRCTNEGRMGELP
jgi:hypothetical protein